MVSDNIVGAQREALILNQTIPIWDSTHERPENLHLLLEAQNIDGPRVENFLQNSAITSPARASYHLLDSMRLLRGIRESARITVILSPGRSGTVSLFSLFNEIESFRPYHNIPLAISGTVISEFFYRGILNKYNSSEAWDTQGSIFYYYDLYIRARMTELMHSGISHVVICNHWETWFSPIVANVFKNSRFIYLERDPVDTVSSLLLSNVHGKKQGLPEILESINTATPKTIEEASRSSNLLQMDVLADDRDKRIFAQLNSMSPLDAAIWQYKQVKFLAAALQKTLPSERFLSVSADRLFAKDCEETGRFMDFFQLDQNARDRVHRHFDDKVNSKGKIFHDQSDGDKIKDVINQRYYST